MADRVDKCIIYSKVIFYNHLAWPLKGADRKVRDEVETSSVIETEAPVPSAAEPIISSDDDDQAGTEQATEAP